MEEIKKSDLPQSEITVPVKFNKETKELSLEEAAALAQKGMKFEAIEKDYRALRDLAQREEKSGPVYVQELAARQREEHKKSLTEKCGGNEEMAEKILALEEAGEKDLDLSEVYEAFEGIKSPDDLPVEVLEGCRLRGTLPLDEYLRYLLCEKKKTDAARKKQRECDGTATGSLINLRGADNPEAEEFLRGLWKSDNR